jgi:biotin carboxylase
MATTPLSILCLASFYKGGPFMQALKAQGHHVLLLTQEKYVNEAWPRESIDELFAVPKISQKPDIFYTVSYLNRGRKIDAVVALDDFDVETAGDLREHLRLPGFGSSLARHFRDKLAMRQVARAGGVAVPEFVRVLNYDDVREFMSRVPPPWLLKPRGEASSMGIRRLQDSEQLWRALDELGDQQSFFVLEQYLPGEVFHVDSLVNDGKVIFATPSRYARPPLNVYQDGGVFVTRTMERKDKLTKALLSINQKTIKALGLEYGATHAEFLRANADGQLYFIECAARVGGANIADMVEQASGVNLWREWAHIEAAHALGEPYTLPPVRQDYAAVVMCLAHQQWPDTSAYNDPEVVWRANKEQHAGVIIASPNAARVAELSDSYAQRFAQDFLMVMPPKESVRQM